MGNTWLVYYKRTFVICFILEYLIHEPRQGRLKGNFKFWNFYFLNLNLLLLFFLSRSLLSLWLGFLCGCSRLLHLFLLSCCRFLCDSRFLYGALDWFLYGALDWFLYGALDWFLDGALGWFWIGFFLHQIRYQFTIYILFKIDIEIIPIKIYQQFSLLNIDMNHS